MMIIIIEIQNNRMKRKIKQEIFFLFHCLQW